MSITENNLSAEELRERYKIERDKRVRNDGPDQYQEPTGRFAHLLEDPYTTIEERAPRTDETTVAIIGGGFAGLCTGARLKAAGINDITIIESGGDFGGVWYWNRYPGAMCDTAAMVYLPLLEETNYFPSENMYKDMKYTSTQNASLQHLISTKEHSFPPASRKHDGMKTAKDG